MTSFNDATCPKCGTRISWVGRLIDKPACPNPKCDYKPDIEELKRVEKQIEQEIEKLEKEERRRPE
jgi:hypothetical protein